MHVALVKVESRLLRLHAGVIDRFAGQPGHMPFAEYRSTVTAFVFQFLDEACMLRGQCICVSGNLGFCCEQPGKNRRTRRRAEWMRPDIAESHALTGKLIQNGCGSRLAANFAIIGMVVS